MWGHADAQEIRAQIPAGMPTLRSQDEAESPTSYKISEKGKEIKKIAVIVDKKKKKKKPVEREYESEGIEYYEELFEE